MKTTGHTTGISTVPYGTFGRYCSQLGLTSTNRPIREHPVQGRNTAGIGWAADRTNRLGLGRQPVRHQNDVFGARRCGDAPPTHQQAGPPGRAAGFGVPSRKAGPDGTGFSNFATDVRYDSRVIRFWGPGATGECALK